MENTLNIRNGINTIYIHYDLISNYIIDGRYSDVIYPLSTANLERSYPFNIETILVGFCKINKYTISSRSIYIIDVYERIIKLNGIDVSFSFILKELKLS